MKTFQLLLLLLPAACLAQTDSLPVAPPETETIWMVVEEMPQFPGGRPALEKYLHENLRYPGEARQAGVKGTVYIGFVVCRDGSICNPQVMRGIGYGCDQEALRLIREMPRWLPGKQRGQPVLVRYSLPIRFFFPSQPR
jgi:protein TonB